MRFLSASNSKVSLPFPNSIIETHREFVLISSVGFPKKRNSNPISFNKIRFIIEEVDGNFLLWSLKIFRVPNSICETNALKRNPEGQIDIFEANSDKNPLDQWCALVQKSNSQFNIKDTGVVVAAGIIPFWMKDGQEYWLYASNKKKTSFFGGNVNRAKDKDPFDCAMREYLEETGQLDLDETSLTNFRKTIESQSCLVCLSVKNDQCIVAVYVVSPPIPAPFLNGFDKKGLSALAAEMKKKTTSDYAHLWSDKALENSTVFCEVQFFFLAQSFDECQQKITEKNHKNIISTKTNAEKIKDFIRAQKTDLKTDAS
jgi:hypothetical protein